MTEQPYTQPVGRVCVNCQVEIKDTTRFCHACGYKQPPTREEIQKELAISKERWLDVRWAIVFYSLWMSITIPVAVMAKDGKNAGLALWIGSMSSALLVIIASVFSRKPIRSLISRLDKNVLYYSIIGLLVLVPALFLNVFYHRAIREFLGADNLNFTELFLENGFGWPGIIIAICVMPGIFEEIGFRGLIQGHLQASVGVKRSIFITAVIFSIMHCAFFSMPYLFLLGLFFGFLRVKTNSLLPGMLIHFLHNLAGCLLDFWHVFN